MFRGFMLQARKFNHSLPDSNEPVGYWESNVDDGIQTICGGTDGQGVSDT